MFERESEPLAETGGMASAARNAVASEKSRCFSGSELDELAFEGAEPMVERKREITRIHVLIR
jgi:hypothetical protein